ncbi:MAG: AroM family protein [Chloroflexi bacterium]|nr:AroM family protein [Chloroflexota bacterium]
MSRIVGAVSTGQTPRPDIVPALRELLGPDFELLERGALDGISQQQIDHLAAADDDQDTVVTRVFDGTFAVINTRQLTPLVQEAIDEAVDLGTQAVALLSTTEFRGLHADVPLVLPLSLLMENVNKLLPSGSLGVLVALPTLEQQAVNRWQTSERLVQVTYASPSGDPRDIERAGHFFAYHKVDAVALNGISYTRAQAKIIGDIVKKPVVIPKVLLAQRLREILG